MLRGAGTPRHSPIPTLSLPRVQDAASLSITGRKQPRFRAPRGRVAGGPAVSLGAMPRPCSLTPFSRKQRGHRPWSHWPHKGSLLASRHNPWQQPLPGVLFPKRLRFPKTPNSPDIQPNAGGRGRKALCSHLYGGAGLRKGGTALCWARLAAHTRGLFLSPEQERNILRATTQMG